MLCRSFFITFEVTIYTKVCFMVIYLLPLIFYHIFIGHLYLLCPRSCGRHYELYKDKGYLIAKACYHPIDPSLKILSLLICPISLTSSFLLICPWHFCQGQMDYRALIGTWWIRKINQKLFLLLPSHLDLVKVESFFFF